MDDLRKNQLDWAYDEGYSAGWEFHLGSGYREENPYFNNDPDCADAWDNGFTAAGEDS